MKKYKYVEKWQITGLKMVTNKNGETYPVPRPKEDYKKVRVPIDF